MGIDSIHGTTRVLVSSVSRSNAQGWTKKLRAKSLGWTKMRRALSAETQAAQNLQNPRKPAILSGIT